MPRPPLFQLRGRDARAQQPRLAPTVEDCCPRSACSRSRWFIQNRNVMLITRRLAAASIKILAPSKLPKTRNMGTSRCARTPSPTRIVQRRRTFQDVDIAREQLFISKCNPISMIDSRNGSCPLYPQKRTLVKCSGMSATCQKQRRAT